MHNFRKLKIYQKAIDLSPLEAVDLYLKSAEIYRQIGDKEKQRETLWTFFERTKNVKNFGRTSTSAITIYKMIMEDLKDLSDWRHYRRLKNKLHS